MNKWLVFLIVALAFNGCTSQNSKDSYTKDDGRTIEIGNPYSPGTGHYAGVINGREERKGHARAIQIRLTKVVKNSTGKSSNIIDEQFLLFFFVRNLSRNSIGPPRCPPFYWCSMNGGI